MPHVTSCLPVPVTCEGMPPGSAATSTPLTSGEQQTTSVQLGSTGRDGGVSLTIPIQPGSFGYGGGVPLVVPQPTILTSSGPSISAVPGYCHLTRMTNPTWTATMPGYYQHVRAESPLKTTIPGYYQPVRAESPLKSGESLLTTT